MLEVLPPLARAEAYLVRVPLRQTFGTSRGVVAARNSWILRLRDHDGRDGFGEIALDPAASPSDEELLARCVRDATAGFTNGRLPDESGASITARAAWRAIRAGLEAALEALAEAGPSASRAPMAPRLRGSIWVNATIGTSEPGPAAEAAAAAFDAGFTCLKIKAGTESRPAFAARIRAIRDAVGSSVRLRIDANAGWSYPAAADMIDAVAALDIEYVEQPLAAGDLAGHARLRHRSAVPIALDESVDSETAAAAILEAGAADVLVVKPARVGGTSAVLGIAHSAAAAGIPVVVSSFFETGIGIYAAVRVAAALPEVGAERAHGLATADTLVHDLTLTSGLVTAGRMAVPERLLVDEAALARFTVAKTGPKSMTGAPSWPSAPPLLGAAARRNAAERGNSLALVDGPRRWNWLELDEAADAVAAGIHAAGIQLGDRVALLSPTSAEAVAFIHGAARAGTVIVPLNDRFADAELAAFLVDVDVAAVAVAEELASRAAAIGRTLAGSGRPRVVSVEALADGPRPNGGPAEEVAASTTAVIVATSGTTGAPKGAILSHGQLAASAAAWNELLPAATGWLASLSMAHVGGLGIVWRAAMAGVPVVVPAAGRNSMRPSMTQPPVSHVSTVAVQLVRLLEAEQAAPPNLRAVLLGGGPVPAELVASAIGRGWPIVPTYGMTESASGVTALPTAEAASRPGSSGRALRGVELRIADPAGDCVGEIEVRGPSIFSGYLGRPDDTAAAFTPDAWYRTGDLGSLDAEGYLHVADRRLDLIVSGGENVYPAEVEAVLTSHPAVADAGVAGRPDEVWGSVPVAAISARPDAVATDEEILAHCRGRLGRFKVPITLVRVAEIPRFGSGKLDRAALRELLSGMRPDS